MLQGERKMAGDNRTLGQFNLDGIPPAPRGVPQIEVTFDIDADGIVHVSAKDKATSKEQSIQIKSSSGLNDSEIDSLVKEAEAAKADDEAKHEMAELRNTLDTMVYQVAKQLSTGGEALDETDRGQLQEALDKAKEALKDGDKEALEAAKENLEQTAHKLAEKMYKANADAQPQDGDDGPDAGGPDSDDDVIDAEFDAS